MGPGSGPQDVELKDSTVVALEVGSMVVVLEVDNMVVALEVGKADVALEVGKADVALEVGKADVALEVGEADVALEVGNIVAALEDSTVAVLEADNTAVEGKRNELPRPEVQVQLTVLEFDGDDDDRAGDSGAGDSGAGDSGAGDSGAVDSGFLKFDSIVEMALYWPEYSHEANVEQIDVLKKQLAVAGILASYWRTYDRNCDASREFPRLKANVTRY